MIRLALRSALSDRAAEGKVLVRRRLGHRRAAHQGTRSSCSARSVCAPRVSATSGCSLVLDSAEDAVWKSFRNLGERVQIVIPDELNTYDVLVNDWLVFSKATLDAAVARFGRAADDRGRRRVRRERRRSR